MINIEREANRQGGVRKSITSPPLVSGHATPPKGEFVLSRCALSLLFKNLQPLHLGAFCGNDPDKVNAVAQSANVEGFFV